MSEETRTFLLNFFSQSYSDLKRRLTRTLGNDDLAADALQDTWLWLECLKGQAPVRNPRAFLLRMATNTALNIKRSQTRAVPPGEVDTLLDLPDPAPGPEQTVKGHGEMARLVAGIRCLPRQRQEILILVRWEGLQQKEVARRLGVSVRSVEYELKHANDFLLHFMENKDK